MSEDRFSQSTSWEQIIGGIGRVLILRDRLLGRVSASRVPGMRLSIASDANLLDATLMGPVKTAVKAVLLICHRIGETVDSWHVAQDLLAGQGVASLVFDYSGYGRSSGRFGFERCERDAVAAFHTLKAHYPESRISLLGFSLGSAIAAAVVSHIAVEQLILCAAFTSLREAAHELGLPRAGCLLMPDVWNTESRLRSCPVPVLILHGEKDPLFPVRMAVQLASACGVACELIVLPNLKHDEPVFHPQMSFWSKVSQRL